MLDTTSAGLPADWPNLDYYIDSYFSSESKMENNILVTASLEQSQSNLSSFQKLSWYSRRAMPVIMEMWLMTVKLVSHYLDK